MIINRTPLKTNNNNFADRDRHRFIYFFNVFCLIGASCGCKTTLLCRKCIRCAACLQLPFCWDWKTTLQAVYILFFYNSRIRQGGNIIRVTFPTIASRGTGPKWRLSILLGELSPNKKYSSELRVIGSATLWCSR